MVKTRVRSKVINNFISELEKHISINKAILFGSSIKGTRKRWSDLDIAIISKDFDRIKPLERLVLLGKIAWRAHTTEVEALGYTPSEYRSANKYDFLYEIKKTGKIIYP